MQANMRTENRSVVVSERCGEGVRGEDYRSPDRLRSDGNVSYRDGGDGSVGVYMCQDLSN